MRRPNSRFQSFYEIAEFGQASSSSSSAMDQRLIWNSTVYNSEEDQEINSNLLSPSHINIPCGNVTQENSSLSSWYPLGPSSNMPPSNQGSLDPAKLESGCTPSSIGNMASGPRIRESRSEANNTLTFRSQDNQLNRNHVNNGEPFQQFLNFHEVTGKTVYNSEHIGTSNQVLELGLPQELFSPGLPQHVSFCDSSLQTFDNSSMAIDFFSNNDGGRQAVMLDDRCSSGKRKNIEGFRGESSAYGSSSNFNEAVDGESFQRNIRKRINHEDPVNTSTPNLWPQENSITHYNLWPAAQPSSAAVPSNQQHLMQTIPGPASEMYSFPQNGNSTTEVGSSSGFQAIAVGAHGDLNSVRDPSNISDQIFFPHHNTRQDHANWGLTNGSTILPGNMAHISQVGTDLAVSQLPEANWVSNQHRRRISEAVRRSYFPSGPDYRGRSLSLPPRHGPSTSQEVGRHHSTAISRGHPHPYVRPLNVLPRQNDRALAIPLSLRALAASREGRSRISEIRNVFDLIRRGDNLLLESVLVGGGNLHDRYGDMRLDVDNMSYEELLALEERIGIVNTGLSEEQILSALRQRKYVSIASEPLEEVEPCCICRVSPLEPSVCEEYFRRCRRTEGEDYVEGEELGRLDCGHDFHTACIKQWLVIKNLCPICKTTALSTGKKEGSNFPTISD